MKFHTWPSFAALTAGVLLGSASLVIWPPAQAADATYRVITRYSIGGQDKGFDYLRLEPRTHRLFVAHATRVEVIDADDGHRIGEIPDTAGVHGIAFAPEFHHGFTSNGQARSITMFDLDSLRTLAEIKGMGIKPDSIGYDGDTKQVFVINGGDSGDITVVKADTGAIVTTIALGARKLEELQLDGHGRGFVNDERANVIRVFDTRKLTPVANWPIGSGEEPTGLAFDPVRHRLFSACANNQLIVLDSESGKVVGTAAIGKDPDGAVFDPRTHRVFVSNHDGTLSVVDAGRGDNYPTIQTVKTEPGARTIALDARNGRLYLPFMKDGPESFGVLVVGE